MREDFGEGISLCRKPHLYESENILSNSLHESMFWGAATSDHDLLSLSERDGLGAGGLQALLR